MIQPGKRMTRLEIEHFLSGQTLTGRYTFKVLSKTDEPYEKTLQNNSDSFEFTAAHPNVVYEFKYATDYI